MRRSRFSLRAPATTFRGATSCRPVPTRSTVSSCTASRCGGNATRGSSGAARRTSSNACTPSQTSSGGCGPRDPRVRRSCAGSAGPPRPTTTSSSSATGTTTRTTAFGPRPRKPFSSPPPSATRPSDSRSSDPSSAASGRSCTTRRRSAPSFRVCRRITTSRGWSSGSAPRSPHGAARGGFAAARGSGAAWSCTWAASMRTRAARSCSTSSSATPPRYPTSFGWSSSGAPSSTCPRTRAFTISASSATRRSSTRWRRPICL